MSDVHSGAGPVDPLEALRAVDRRPSSEVWRERLTNQLRELALSAYSQRLATALAIIVLAFAGWQLVSASEPPVEDSIPLAIADTAPETPSVPVVPEVPTTEQGSASTAPLIVHVAGAVSNPGLVSGTSGWRVDDAIRAAGGATHLADLDRLNLAAPIADGQRIYVPEAGEEEPVPLAASGPQSTEASAPALVDINSADLVALQTLPGVGPATAATIIEHRLEFGPFADVDALVAVRGIGPATLERLRAHVRIG